MKKLVLKYFFFLEKEQIYAGSSPWKKQVCLLVVGVYFPHYSQSVTQVVVYLPSYFSVRNLI